jgi:hypothetical protein
LKSSSPWIAILFCAGLVLSACQPAIPTPLPDITLPAPTLAFPEYPEAASAAQAALADRLGLSAEEVAIEQVVPALWPDSCLGLAAEGEICLQVITSGYLVTLRVGDRSHEYRTDLEGRAVRAVPAAMVKPSAVDSAIQALAQQLAIDPALITLAGYEAVDWPDSCLGVTAPDVMCAQVITPGYRIQLIAQGQLYEYHSNLDGTQLVAAPSASIQPEEPVIVLVTKDPQAGCQEIQVTRYGVGAGACGSEPEIKPYPGMQRPVELEIWQERYAPFTVEAADGSLTFSGRGVQTAGAEEQRALIAWTRLAALDVTGELVDPPQGLLIDWRRTGGPANTCDRLMIFESGFAYARDCQDAALGQTLLQTEQIKLLYNWRDNLKTTIATAKSDAGGYQYELVFNGVGEQSPDEATRQNMFVLAAQLYDLLVP